MPNFGNPFWLGPQSLGSYKKRGALGKTSGPILPVLQALKVPKPRECPALVQGKPTQAQSQEQAPQTSLLFAFQKWCLSGCPGLVPVGHPIEQSQNRWQVPSARPELGKGPAPRSMSGPSHLRLQLPHVAGHLPGVQGCIQQTPVYKQSV